LSVDQGAYVNWATIFALGFGNILAIDFAARIFSAKSAKEARRGCYIGGITTLVLGLPFALLPLVIQYLGIVPEAGVPILMTFGSNTLPAVVYALLICGIIAASLSTIDGAMLSMGNIVTHNFLNLKKDVSSDEPEESERIQLYFSRLTLVPIAFLAMAFAIALPTPGVLLTVAFDIMFAALLVPFLAAFYTKQPNITAAIAAIVTGAAIRTVFAILTPTAFGVPNTIFYVENTIIPPTWDGVGTILAPVVAAIVYIGVTVINRYVIKTYDPAH
jgi:SSS family solute:Na+ symporter